MDGDDSNGAEERALPPLLPMFGGINVNNNNREAQNLMADPERALMHDNDNPQPLSSTHGWVEVEPEAGGLPPSARSLHSSALLNVSRTQIPTTSNLRTLSNISSRSSSIPGRSLRIWWI